MTVIKPCLVIPVFNHAEQLEKLIKPLQALSLCCLLIDDGSDHCNAEILDRLAKNHDFLELIRLKQNSGKGAAVITGIRHALGAGFTHALQLDADGQHNLADIPKLLDLSRQNPLALVSGKPVYDDSAPRSRVVGRYLTHIWVWIETLSFTIADSMCGFRVYPTASTCSLADKHRIAKRMDFDTDVMVRLFWEGVPVVFLPTHVRYPVGGVSHFNLLKDNLRITSMHTILVIGMLIRLPALLWRRITIKQKTGATYT